MEEELTTLLAGVAGGRRYWTMAPQGLSVTAGPYLVLNRIDGIRNYHYQGPSGYVASRVQIDAYGGTYAATKAAARAVISTLSGYTGGSIQGIFIQSERDLPASDAGDVTNLFRTSLDIIVHEGELQ